jgi:GNAT superfamily N-acetyltransferase
MITGESHWRAMTAADLAAVFAISAALHPDLPERPEVLGEKFRLFPQGCFVLERAGEAVGYALSHPWLENAVPPLDTFLGEIPREASCLYLHDAAVLPGARGQASALLVDRLRMIAEGQGLSRLALVSVYGTTRLWGRFGFAAADDPALAGKLACYGPTARYMTAPAR